MSPASSRKQPPAPKGWPGRAPHPEEPDAHFGWQIRDYLLTLVPQASSSAFLRNNPLVLARLAQGQLRGAVGGLDFCRGEIESDFDYLSAAQRERVREAFDRLLIDRERVLHGVELVIAELRKRPACAQLPKPTSGYTRRA